MDHSRTLQKRGSNYQAKCVITVHQSCDCSSNSQNFAMVSTTTCGFASSATEDILAMNSSSERRSAPVNAESCSSFLDGRKKGVNLIIDAEMFEINRNRTHVGSGGNSGEEIISSHCPILAKDCSDCVMQHFNWPSDCCSRRDAVNIIVKGALRGRWGVPVRCGRKSELKEHPRVGIANAVESSSRQGSVLGKRKEGTDGLVTEKCSELQVPLKTRAEACHGRECEYVIDLSGRQSKGSRMEGQLCVNSDVKTNAMAACRRGDSEEPNQAKLLAVIGSSSAVSKPVDTQPRNDGASYGVQNKVAYKTYQSKEETAWGEGASSSSACLEQISDTDDGKGLAELSRENQLDYDRDSEKCISIQQKKMKPQRIDAAGDPLEVFGMDLMLRIFSRLDACSLARCGVVLKGWQALVKDDNLWIPQCEGLWQGKPHLPCSALRDGLPKMEAYSTSVIDSKRTRITRKDLCDHAWEFRFKSIAPDYWLSLDPSWRGEPSMLRYFHWDGSQTAGPNDSVWGGHECSYYLIDVPSTGGSTCRYVRINHWPKMTVSRTENWGWELNNDIYVYNSVPDFWKFGGTGPLCVK